MALGQAEGISTGWSISRCDIELFVRLRMVFWPQHIFIIGNSWGYSTLVLSCIFSAASVDAIDPNGLGVNMTMLVATMARRNIAVFKGFSPKDTHRAMRAKRQLYELVFIDGEHTNTQMFQDFVGIYPHLAVRSVVVLHDLVWSQLQRGVYTILCAFPEMRFAYYMSLAYPDLAMGATGFMWRGFSDDAFAGFHGLENPYRCVQTQMHKHPIISMAPKLLPKDGKDDGILEVRCLAGILHGPICCAPECVKCCGPYCDRWPGSGDRCCGRSIQNICTSAAGPPPCVYRGTTWM